MNRKFTIMIMLFCCFFLTIIHSQCDSTICQCSSNTCQYCLSSLFYYSSSHQNCYQCKSSCKTCVSATNCTSCQDLFYYANGLCLQCPIYCKTCTSNTVCSTCIDGFVLIGSVCQQCQIPNVQTCQSLTTVQTCQSGYWKNGDSCSSCRQFCNSCTSSNNCLQCADGFQAQISAGTYCMACPSGCKTCSNSICSQCFNNYKLVNGVCQSISTLCSQIAYCNQCQFMNNSVTCVLCQYPYYLLNGSCKIGSSLLCAYANGKNPYQCLVNCSNFAYQLTQLTYTSIPQIICLPNLWLKTSNVQQIYLNAQYDFGLFTPSNMTYETCSSTYIYSNSWVSQTNILTFLKTFDPYYKIVINMKWVPLFLAISPTSNLSFTIIIADNATNSFNYQQNHTASSFNGSCQEQYSIITSKFVKDQLVTMKFESTLTDKANVSTSVLNNTFINGLIGYRQLIFQIYRCDSKCRICSNSMYCLECYGQYFLSNSLCANACEGLFQYYVPNGDYINYKSKYCVEECPSGYYSSKSPLNNGTTFICLKCPTNCTSCNSPTQCLSCVSSLLFYSINFSCIQSCPKTHYNSSNQCVLCNAPCSTCTNSTNCLSCSMGYFNGINCVGLCPNGTFANISTKTCDSCHSACSSCLNSKTYCLSCVAPYKLLGSNCLTACPAFTYYQSNSKCIACKSPCVECLNETACLTCSRGYLYQTSCLSTCPSTYYKDVGQNTCTKCQNNCLTCLSLNICNSCINGTYLYNSMCVSQCPIKTYNNVNSICVPCLPPCLTCLDSSRCLTCQIGYLSLITPYNCLNNCESGYFAILSNQTCAQCSSLCLTCNQQASFCLSCPNETLLQSNKCVSQCSDGYYNFSSQCRPCTYPCKTCTQSSSKCLTCYTPYIYSNLTNSCVLQCISSQYQQKGFCVNCVYPCSTCSSLTTCTSCAFNGTNQTYFYNGSCQNSCPSGMYSDDVTLICKSCIFPCQNCYNSRQCISCISGYLNPQSNTCEICSSKYYADQTTKTCVLCSKIIPYCSQCQSNTICKVCQSGFYLIGSLCISQSDCLSTAGYYLNMAQQKCSQCLLPCANCTSSNICLSCVNGFFYQGQCLFNCPDNFYSSLAFMKCFQCDTSVCLNCVNNATTCLSCNQSSLLNVYYLQMQTCIQKSQCFATYYIDSSYGYMRCLKCVAPCKECLSASKCTSCLNGVLFQNQCGFSCPRGYFSTTNNNSAVKVCQKCSNICQQCSTISDNCISCLPTQYLQKGKCVINCSQTYYLDQNILECQLCESPCYGCISTTYCTSCQNSSYILYYGQCLSICPQGTFANALSICQTCPNSCQLCQYSNSSQTAICTLCISGLFMNSSTLGKCQKQCSYGQYPDNQTRKCYPCQIPCLTCQTATQCVLCIDGYLVYKNQCYKGSICPSGAFKDPFQKLCLDRCLAPYYGDSFTNQCQMTCNNNFLKIPGQQICSSSCPSNYYVDANQTCIKCSSTICNNLLTYQLESKSIFNSLYLKIRFSKSVITNQINESNIQLMITPISMINHRLLQQTSYQINFTISQYTDSSVWLEILTNQTLSQVQITLNFADYYLLQPVATTKNPQMNLQVLSSTIVLDRFDQYTENQKQKGQSFELFSQFLSIALCLIIIIALVINSVSLFYSIIDYYQLLFMCLFLQIDYPPNLNYFLYGFRFSHYLFLPQIFQNGQKIQYNQQPGQFGIVVPDADFLSNTGHDFFILFIVLGIIVVAKLMNFLISGCIKSNKVSNDQQIDIDYQLKRKEQIQSQNQEEKKSQSALKSRHVQIQKQILQGKHGVLAKYLKILILRLKWNYFNDIAYCIYFYVALFSFSQTYVIEQASTASNFFGIMSLILVLILPCFLIYLIYKNQEQIQQNPSPLAYKTFTYFKNAQQTLTIYWIPYKYIKKLLLAILLVYCSKYPTFILGIIVMSSLLEIILNCLYNPFLLKFDRYLQGGIQLLFIGVMLSLCAFQITYLDLSTTQKYSIGNGAVVLIFIFSIVLILWNVARLVVQLIKECNGKDYFEGYYVQRESSQKQTQRQSSQHQSSNVRLKQQTSPKYFPQQKLSNALNSQSNYSQLDIYLKKDNKAPPMLIKCLKDFQNKSSNSQSSDEEDQESNQKESHSQEEQTNNQIKRQKDYSKQSEQNRKIIVKKNYSHYHDSNNEDSFDKNEKSFENQKNQQQIQRSANIIQFNLDDHHQNSNNQQNESQHSQSRQSYENSHIQQPHRNQIIRNQIIKKQFQSPVKAIEIKDFYDNDIQNQNESQISNKIEEKQSQNSQIQAFSSQENYNQRFYRAHKITRKTIKEEERQSSQSETQKQGQQKQQESEQNQIKVQKQEFLFFNKLNPQKQMNSSHNEDENQSQQIGVQVKKFKGYNQKE